VIGYTDRTFTPNPAVGRLQMLAAATRDPAELSAVRLSLAVVLMKVEAWSDALAELQKLRLPEGPGVSAGTVHYLTGLCHEALGQRSQAQQAWQLASSSEASLTEDGPPVAPLAQAKLRGGSQ
jgi:predicted negative regulator of RcsB-dependent stress response